MSSSPEAKYQEAMRQAREAQDAHFTVTALKYAQERKQFGQPIGHFQMNQDMIAQMVELNRRRAVAKCQGVHNGNLVFEATITGMSV